MAFGQIVMTKLAVASGVPPLPAMLLGILACVGLRNAERRARDGHPAAGVHRHARHAEHRVCPNAHRLERPDLLGASERAPLLRPHVHARRSGLHVRRRVDARPVRAGLVRADPDGLGPTRLRRRRQPGGGAADGDQRQPRPVQRLRARRPDLRDRRDAARRAAPSSATRTPARRPRTSTASPRSCSAAPASSAAAGP